MDINGAERGNPEAQFRLGQRFGVPKDKQTAFKWYLQAANQKHAHAQSEVGYYYEAGLGGEPKDIDLAVHYYQMSAQGGDPRGQAYLGTCYVNGVGVEKDLKKGGQLFEKSAEQGYEGLAISYANGEGGLPKDPKMAVKYYKLGTFQTQP